MKIGDMVQRTHPNRSSWDRPRRFGIVVDFIHQTHSKAWPKIKVATDSGIETWLKQWCIVIKPPTDTPQ